MKGPIKRESAKKRERLTEAYEVRAFREEDEVLAGVLEEAVPEPLRAETGALQAIKGMIHGHGEQMILPDDCQFGDNDLCYVES